MTAVTVLLAQVVLTLRSVFFGRDRFMLITTERNRIYAVTKKNRMVTSCFRRDNDIAVYSWSIHVCLCSNERM